MTLTGTSSEKQQNNVLNMAFLHHLSVGKKINQWVLKGCPNIHVIEAQGNA